METSQSSGVDERTQEQERKLARVTDTIRRNLEPEAFGVIEVHIQDGRLVRTKVSRTENIP